MMRPSKQPKRRKVEREELLQPGRVRRPPAHAYARVLTVRAPAPAPTQVACAMTSFRSSRNQRKEAGECSMTRWAYGVKPEANAMPPLHVRCAGCGARICCSCLESCADVLETVLSRSSMRQLRVLPHEFWAAWRARTWRPDRPTCRAFR